MDADRLCLTSQGISLFPDQLLMTCVTPLSYFKFGFFVLRTNCRVDKQANGLLVVPCQYLVERIWNCIELSKNAMRVCRRKFAVEWAQFTKKIILIHVFGLEQFDVLVEP